MSQHHKVAAALIDVEAALRNMGQWEPQAPEAAALRSEQPFAVDTLQFNQWLQFIFIPRMHFLIAEQHELPSACGVAPMAEEFYGGQKLPVAELLKALKAIDELLSNG